jgi:hypothetical protein
MFCAGLLLSIADLLRFFDLQHQLALPQKASSNQQHVPRQLSVSGTRGDNLLPRGLVCPRLRRLAGSCQYDTVSPRAFQPGTCGNRFFLDNMKVSPIPSLEAVVYNPGVGNSVLA